MALESGTYIDSLNVANPVSTDALAQADDHLRLIKSTIKATFPNLTGAVTLTHAEINALQGLAGQLSAPSGTRLLLNQSAAPTGWTKVTSENDKALRVVSGSVTTGGSAAFSTAFASYTPAGSVSTTVGGTINSHTLTVNEIPAHEHLLFANVEVNNSGGNATSSTQVPRARGVLGDSSQDHKYQMGSTSTAATLGKSSSVGGGAGHSHGHSLTATSAFTGTAKDLAVQYVDVIIAQKD
ncbi:MAG: hypothetical protein CMI29_09035 [Opitutae bacterium]|nr:hypothetical protein [Opitutae bacterium]|tara:strand:- start:10772 stop:11488 length:717 start_codon:yes stop_codon:yes gene_type:complete